MSRHAFLVVAALLTGCGNASSSDPSPVLEDAGAEDAAYGADSAAPAADSTVSMDSEASDVADDSLDDATTADSLTPDTFVVDAFVADSFVADSFVADTFVADTFVADSFVADTFVADTFVAETFVADTFVPDTFVGGSCEAPPPVGMLGYTTLSTANVYASGASGPLRSCFVEYTPVYGLWSDGLAKRRWIYLPPGTKIQTGPSPVGGAVPNMDRWVFPVGTRFIKEFSRADGKKVETRIWERLATGYRMGSFKWRVDQTDADYTESGGPANFTLDDGVTVHQIPRRVECFRCHDGEPGEGLGFSGVQLSKPSAPPGDLTLLAVIAKGWLSHPPTTMPQPSGSPVPGSSTESAALGALHASCGHCHNPLGQAAGANMQLRINWGESSVASTKLYTQTVGVPTTTWSKFGITLRIDPGPAGAGNGVPSLSAVHYRASVRGGDEMPTIGTQIVDKDGLLKALDAWIRSL